ncbi:NADAR family protein [Altererythrobacter lutimaris]|uniref:NADAR family protein n=1 Tax=Altererythrobacter lutimaris TaxID=2743979 RepID=A0A850HBZ7_9SPHN|nr:NADAR family protein [Altererythrobacter lutimaris]NVE94531.1 NADAR family protein [Altererythrobacter lutimaris]
MTSEKFTFFWNGPFSQWYKSPFTIDGQYYNTAEQYMMAEKARLFGDDEALGKILEATDPAVQKAWGRKVKGFDQEKWEKARSEIVYRGSRAKFTTHRDLLQMLLDTEGTSLAEASPVDTIWGIGLAADAKDASDRSKWLGQNLLGEILQNLRDELLEEQRGEGIPELVERARRKAKK